MERGKFIAIEGPDGAGTTTQAAMLVKKIEAGGIKVHATREPSDGPIGRLIRDSLRKNLPGRLTGQSFGNYEMQLLFSADRADHLKHEIEPQLENGLWVVSERYFYSTFTYGNELNLRNDGINYDSILRQINSAFRTPDLAFYLDLSAEECLERIEKRGKEKELYEKKEFLERVIEVYRTESRNRNEFVTVDARSSADDVNNLVYKIVRERLLSAPIIERSYS